MNTYGEMSGERRRDCRHDSAPSNPASHNGMPLEHHQDHVVAGRRAPEGARSGRQTAGAAASDSASRFSSYEYVAHAFAATPRNTQGSQMARMQIG